MGLILKFRRHKVKCNIIFPIETIKSHLIEWVLVAMVNPSDTNSVNRYFTRVLYGLATLKLSPAAHFPAINFSHIDLRIKKCE